MSNNPVPETEARQALDAFLPPTGEGGGETDAAAAKAEGFTVDRHCYPWVAYKGSRFNPSECKYIRTDDECELALLRTQNEKLVEAADEALNVLIGCVVAAGGCDDRDALNRAKATLRAALRLASGDR
jgi:hypothetical protein